MNSHRLTAAEYTAAAVQTASHGGKALLIPGARERRAARPAAPLGSDFNAPLALATPIAASGVPDPTRLWRELEGGGAASERRTTVPVTLVAKLRRWFGRG